MRRRALEILRTVSTAMGNVVGRIVLTVLYFTLLLPFALWTRLRTDPLRSRPKHAEWLARPASPSDLDRARQQY